MKVAFDLLPALLFFATYASLGIYPATAVLIVALFALVGFYWWREHRIHKAHLLTAAVAAVFGGLTLYLRDPTFIKLKPTIVYGLIATILLASHFVGRRVLLERVGQEFVKLPEVVWRRVNFAWVLFFAFCGSLNLYVAHRFAEKTWVIFNVFGLTALTFVFILLHALVLSRYFGHDEPS
jgi:intracellular septation protein